MYLPEPNMHKPLRLTNTLIACTRLTSALYWGVAVLSTSGLITRDAVTNTCSFATAAVNAIHGCFSTGERLRST